ncbi:MAG: NYN domain-containing protein [Candidatus Omnitrophota bacterium]
MSLHYLLDGYNIINQLPVLAGKKFQERRDSFVHSLEVSRPQGSARNSVTVVFDGRAEVWGECPSGPVQVIFTRGESADEKIKMIVEEASNKKRIVVVTDDREIRYHVRRSGALVLSVKEFIAKMRPGRTPAAGGRGGQDQESGERVSKSLEYKINSEFANIWLNKKPEKN